MKQDTDIIYDIVISFAGEDRFIASEINDALKRAGLRTFYDEDHLSALWGSNLAERLQHIYSQSGRMCLMLVSKHYIDKVWTRHERRSAISRMIREKGEYVLPYLLDDTDLSALPGISPETCYLSHLTTPPIEVVRLILEKVGRPVDFLATLHLEMCAHFLLHEIYKRCPIANPSFSDLYHCPIPLHWGALREAAYSHFSNLKKSFRDNRTVRSAIDSLAKYNYVVYLGDSGLGPFYGLTARGVEFVEKMQKPSNLNFDK